MDLLERMREKVFLLADPDSGYTQEDFDREFNPKTMDMNPNFDEYKINFKFKFLAKTFCFASQHGEPCF